MCVCVCVCVCVCACARVCVCVCVPVYVCVSRMQSLNIPTAVRYLLESDPSIQVLGAAYIQHQCYHSNDAKNQVSPESNGRPSSDRAIARFTFTFTLTLFFFYAFIQETYNKYICQKKETRI